VTGAPDAIVLGAGVAGLSAATRLAEAGARVLVLEARPSGGGRATAFTDPVTGERVDNGQHALFGCYRETFRFLERIGARDCVRSEPGLVLDLVLPDGRPTRLGGPALPAGLPASAHLAASILGWTELPWADRLSAARLTGPLREAQAALRRAATDSSDRPAVAPPVHADETVEAWLRRHQQGERLIAWLWEPLALAALNQPMQVAAAAPFVRVLAELLDGDRGSAALALPTRPLDALYVTPSMAYLAARGGDVRMGAAGRLVTGESGRMQVEVGGARGGVLAAPVVVCAVPWFELPRTLAGLLPEVPGLQAVVDAAAGTAASPIVTVNLWYDRPLLDGPVLGLPGRTFQWAFERRRLVAGGTHVSLVSSGAEHVLRQPNEQLNRLAADELEAAVPAARNAVLQRALAVREPRATFSLAPGQPPRPSLRTPVPGLFLAGDWIDTGLPATIEGAAVSGHRAADAALALLHPPL